MHAGNFETFTNIVQHEIITDYFFLGACCAHQVTRERIKPTTSDNCVSNCLSSRCCGDDLHRQGNTGYSVREEKQWHKTSAAGVVKLLHVGQCVCLRGGKAGLTLF